jgi:hypothetical protein
MNNNPTEEYFQIQNTPRYITNPLLEGRLGLQEITSKRAKKVRNIWETTAELVPFFDLGISTGGQDHIANGTLVEMLIKAGQGQLAVAKTTG